MNIYNKYATHRTHTGEIITGQKVLDAVKTVCEEWRDLAEEVRREDAYASHITENQKDEFMRQSITLADDLESGKINPTFTDWQRINTQLTGKCIALLP